MNKRDVIAMLILLPFVLAIIYVGWMINGF